MQVVCHEDVGELVGVVLQREDEAGACRGSDGGVGVVCPCGLQLQGRRCHDGLSVLPVLLYAEAAVAGSEEGVGVNDAVDVGMWIATGGVGRVVGDLHGVAIVIGHAHEFVAVFLCHRFHGRHATGTIAAPPSGIFLHEGFVLGHLGQECHVEGGDGIRVLIVHAIDLLDVDADREGSGSFLCGNIHFDGGVLTIVGSLEAHALALCIYHLPIYGDFILDA